LNSLLSYKILIPLALLFGLMPFTPQPHLFEKVGMLIEGTLRRPIDIFDLFWHTWPIFLLLFKAVSDITRRNRS